MVENEACVGAIFCQYTFHFWEIDIEQAVTLSFGIVQALCILNMELHLLASCF